ncbi:hypothetical Protein YC6258_05694 [Gynuella sunshinyii YC6258]|uniref:Uncharacterized protein n=1 Tax=Gynuella sunshinyii YC6258 TaxID=1445510 RepID=A0A0C5VSS0_9GAMM|nr:hypothetical Protein YC6258_05694 [Gynuella sunshinyii YC6258]
MTTLHHKSAVFYLLYDLGLSVLLLWLFLRMATTACCDRW